MENKNLENVKDNSYFDGGLLSLILLVIVGGFISTLTLGICYPWAICLIYKWEVENTVIEGKRLKFTGTGIGLFGNWIKLFLLIIVTFGLYSFWAAIFIKKWKAKNTIFA